jgi:hypothetical protein
MEVCRAASAQVEWTSVRLSYAKGPVVNVCPQCGLSLSADSDFCPTCGWTRAPAREGQTPDFRLGPYPEADRDPFPWRMTLALLAWAAMIVAAWVAVWTVRRHISREWAHGTELATLLVITVAVTPVAIKVATLIYPELGRHFESRRSIVEDNLQRDMRRRWDPRGRYGVAYIAALVCVGVLFVVLSISCWF